MGDQVMKRFSVKRKLWSEAAESLPAVIVSAIVSSFVLLGVAGMLAFVVEVQKDAEVTSNVNSTVSNITTRLATDTEAATHITAASGTNVTFSTPVASSATDCKTAQWVINGTTLTRTLTVYNSTVDAGSGDITCNPSGTVIVTNERTVTTSLEAGSTFQYYNGLGRELTVNANTGVVSPAGSATCPFGATYVANCPSYDPALVAAWNDTSIVTVTYNFTITGSSDG